MKLSALFEKASALPNVPKVVQELIESFNKDNVSIDEIAKKIAADQVLSAKLLRLANSAHYHVSREIGTVNDAVVMLGFVTVRTLVISSGLTGSFKSMPGLDLPRFWLYSLKVACVAKYLAKIAKQNQDLAFTVGMLHGIGQLLMHISMPEQMMELDKVAGPLEARRYQVERTNFGFDYAAVGAGLATHWKFPQAFSQAIQNFPEPLQSEPVDLMACLIHIAAWRVRAEEHGLTPEQVAATWPINVASKLKLTDEAILTNMPPIHELTAGMESLVG